jgi:hypothetical protein
MTAERPVLQQHLQDVSRWGILTIGTGPGTPASLTEASELSIRSTIFCDGPSFISPHVYGRLAVLAEIRLRADDPRFKEFKNSHRFTRRTVP